MIAALALLAAASAPSVADAERAFAAMAQTDGQWTAFRATAAADAIMFVPAMTKAQAWLKGRADPKEAIKWWPGSALVSCDGTLAVSTGGWSNNGGKAHGTFTTIWHRTATGWRWLLDMGSDTPEVVTKPTAPTERVASCSKRSSAAHLSVWPMPDIVLTFEGGPPVPGIHGIFNEAGFGREQSSGFRDLTVRAPDARDLRPFAHDERRDIGKGSSDDGTLRWTITLNPLTGERILQPIMWRGDGFDMIPPVISKP